MEVKVGDKVRIKPEHLDGYLVEYQKKVENREAIVLSLPGNSSTNAFLRVEWQKRKNRGKTWAELVTQGSFSKYWEILPRDAE